ncbi:MAG: non-canonical purine NTP pyrophosphatase [Nitrospinae bacterium]|nr:non-canonical purine NTP pyrophosphatase [Nitrospinota bacterium]
MSLTLVVGTKNQAKLVEIQSILSGLDLVLMPLTDFPDAPDVVEDGLTYRENAEKKARIVAAWSGMLTLAEDSGLEVTALAGEPGVRTGRFGGPALTPRERYMLLLQRLCGVPLAERHATFRCTAVLADPAGHMLVREGRCEGMIGDGPRGEEGFGYDPVFIVRGMGRTLAELSPMEKDVLSHRAHAIRAMLPLLTALARGESWSAGMRTLGAAS